MARLTDKVAVITGASKGIGAGIAKRLAAEGASVVVNYASSADGANRIVDEIGRSGAKALAVGTKVESITKSLAKEFAPRKIRVNGVSPGFVITEGTHSAGMAGGEFEAWAVANSPLGRAGKPEDIAAAVAFLASDDASWITGELLRVAGGLGM